MSPFISIIIPVYNTGKYIENCLSSVKEQTFSNYEVIIVDDGCTDSSGKLCDGFAKKDNRITVIHKQNGGVSSARNIALERAKGKWILFVDSDDELYLDSLQYLLNYTSDSVSLVIGGYVKYNEDNIITYQNKIEFCDIISREKALMYMYNPKIFPYQGYLWNKLFRADIIKNCHLHFVEDIYFNEDRLFITQYLCNCNGSIIYSSKPVYKYFERDCGAMASLKKGFNKKYLTDTLAYIQMYNEIKKIQPQNDLKKAAQGGILCSYYVIQRMLSEFKVKDRSILLKQDLLMIKHIPLLFFKVKVYEYLKLLKEHIL